jgi:endonuclease-3
LLKKDYPNTTTALHFGSPLEMLVATMLSAQTTDKIVNQITQSLFKKYKTPEDYANAPLEVLEEEIKSTGFYHNKAKFLKGMGQKLVKEFNSKVPNTMSELIQLPGVARKTANVVLWNAYRVVEGIAVDTHVQRLAQRLGLSKNKDPNQIEKDLMDLIPQEEWPHLTNLLIAHGRRVCTAKKPKCKECSLRELCPSADSF